MPPPHTRRILLVDDDPLLRRMLHDALTRHGASVASAADANTAVARLERERFDALVTDVDMPGHSGLWLLRQARDRWADLPVILITGRPPDPLPPPAARPDAVLLKPFGVADLLDRIRAVTSA